jgi:hypothetical protein
MHTGWIWGRRVYGCLLHFAVCDGKVWVKHNGTEIEVADELEKRGIVKRRSSLDFIRQKCGNTRNLRSAFDAGGSRLQLDQSLLCFPMTVFTELELRPGLRVDRVRLAQLFDILPGLKARGFPSKRTSSVARLLDGFALHRLPLANQSSAILHARFDAAQRKRLEPPSVPRRL